MNKNLKLLSSFIGPIGFILIGIMMIMKKNNIVALIGYINIFSWSGLLLFKLYKLTKQKQ